jgi:hypothetical protein
MSLELHIFLKREVTPDRLRWQESIDALGMPLTLNPDLDLSKDSGFSPSKLNGEDSGFEIYPTDAREVLSAYPHLSSIVGNCDYVISFRWGGDLKECASVLFAVAALVKDCGGIAYSPHDDTVCDFDQLVAEAKQCL